DAAMTQAMADSQKRQDASAEFMNHPGGRRLGGDVYAGDGQPGAGPVLGMGSELMAEAPMHYAPQGTGKGLPDALSALLGQPVRFHMPQRSRPADGAVFAGAEASAQSFGARLRAFFRKAT
ncbi:MAG TPA: hypothetical protein VLM11_01645, partial [Streptosporangiaceae bacterium]|nr:hypothetical protein [Streptosporangiaceae bacterium]